MCYHQPCQLSKQCAVTDDNTRSYVALLSTIVQNFAQDLILLNQCYPTELKCFTSVLSNKTVTAHQDRLHNFVSVQISKNFKRVTTEH